MSLSTTDPSSQYNQAVFECYSLPYGGLGALSTILTLYTFGMTLLGRKPIFPFMEIEHSTFDFIIATISAIITTVTSIIAIKRCDGVTSLELIAVFKLLLSITLNFCTMWRAGVEAFSFLTGVVGVVCMISGAAGAGLIASNNWHVAGVPALTLTIWLIGILPAICCTICVISGIEVWKVLVGFGAYIIIAIMFWSDWIISCITGDFGGSPDGKVAIVYWVYFAAKRLPMFAM
ncbi:hypothetical protein G7Y89_g9761 [Cudoniella acicularis]|uniref:Uncharacterized protein n=1 Tax=Cudoniella acicularis TaxID=354080 RepID=A0A8H4RE21_9HELO|nr:hypothetical protein G7Y89_g9761 [Cudoniella acicularis]